MTWPGWERSKWQGMHQLDALPTAAALHTHCAHLPSLPTPCQVSALRFLSQKGICNCDFLVATTAMCTGSSLLAGLLPGGGSGGSGAAEP